MAFHWIPWRIRRRLQKWFARPDRFLREVRGVVHVGANDGRERATYVPLGLRVLWVEPVPEVFAALQSNVGALPGHRAVQALITNQDGAECELNVANNQGQSSSIFEMKDHKDIWPDVAYSRTLKMRTRTLDSLLRDEGVDAADYDALVMDTQGAELLVLQGAERSLRGFRYIKAEAADFESYAGCCQVRDLQAFLEARGYREAARLQFAAHPSGGGYYDIVYRRVAG